MNEAGGRKILVVDDDDGTRSLLARFLQKSGYTVVAAASGTEAIQQTVAHGATLALVLLDMTMPGMDGEQTFEALHKLQPDLPFLIYTGGCESSALLRLVQTGWCLHVLKPVPMALLLQKIQLLLARHPRPMLA